MFELISAEEIGEVWKDIPDYEGYYQVSDMGRVRSLDRFVIKYNKHTVFICGEIRKIKINRRLGYSYIILSKNGTKKTFSIHRLVAMSFLGRSERGHKIVIDHINSIKTDNRLSNLQLITQRQNVAKGIRNCTSKYIGVSYYKRYNKWRSGIIINGNRRSLGYFSSEEEAAEAYQVALKAHIESGGQ